MLSLDQNFNGHDPGAFRLLSMVAGDFGVPGGTALGPAVEGYSTHFGPVTTLCPRTVANTARARGSSTAPVTPRPALIPMVRDIFFHIETFHRRYKFAEPCTFT